MQVWKIRSYTLMLTAQSTSTLVGAGMNVIFPLLILHFTGSLAAAGLVGALRSAPYLFLSLPLGALVDRWNRRRIMMACQIGRFVSFFFLGLVAHYGVVSQWHIYFVCLLDGVLFVFFNIAEAAALSSVVPRELLPQASSMNEAAFGTAATLGPAVGAFVYQLWGVGGALFGGAVCYFVSFVLLKILKVELNVQREKEQNSLAKDIAEGVRWLWSEPLVLLLACIMGALNLINSAMPLLAITVGRGLGANDASVGTVVACGGIGSVLGSICGTHWLRMQGFGRGVVLATWMHAAAVAALIFVPNLPMLGFVYGTIIAFYSLYAVMQFSYRVRSVPERLQGRVNSSCRLIAFSLYPLGSTLAGAISEYWGARALVLYLTAAAVVLACILTFSRSIIPMWREGARRL